MEQSGSIRQDNTKVLKPWMGIILVTSCLLAWFFAMTILLSLVYDTDQALLTF